MGRDVQRTAAGSRRAQVVCDAIINPNRITPWGLDACVVIRCAGATSREVVMMRKAFERIGRAGVVAWSDGGELRIPLDAPRTMNEALLRTASEHGDRGILHVRADGSAELQRY